MECRGALGAGVMKRAGGLRPPGTRMRRGQQAEYEDSENETRKENPVQPEREPSSRREGGRGGISGKKG